jgi:hypothetical protein
VRNFGFVKSEKSSLRGEILTKGLVCCEAYLRSSALYIEASTIGIKRKINFLGVFKVGRKSENLSESPVERVEWRREESEEI